MAGGECSTTAKSHINTHFQRFIPNSLSFFSFFFGLEAFWTSPAANTSIYFSLLPLFVSLSFFLRSYRVCATHVLLLNGTIKKKP